jgi:prophage DNA circulation protein
MADQSDPQVDSQYPIASFTIAGVRLTFAIEDDKTAGGNRLVQHKRPYRKGAKLDSTGKEPRVWTGTAIFNNSIKEPGLGNAIQYPDNMNAVIAAFDAQETGDLVTPSDGQMRARAFTYERTKSRDEDDTGRLNLTYVEDNEDDVDATAFAKPNVRGSLIRLAEQTVFTAQQEGTWSSNIADLREFCANLEGLINAPGEAIDSVVVQARAAQHAMLSVLHTLHRTVDEAPVRTIAAVKALIDVSAWAPEEHLKEQPKRIPFYVTATTTIWAIAALVRQSPERLLEINEGRIDDPFAIQPGTYRVEQL